MSQAGIINVAGGGGGGSPVQTITTDDGSTAIPVANNIVLGARDTRDNDDDGIRTNNDPDGSNIIYVELTNRLQGAVSTIGAVTSPIITFTPTVIGTYIIECRVVAYNTTSVLGSGYSIFVAIRYDGANSNLTGVPDIIVNEEGTMSNAKITVTVSGANVLINGVGYAAQTINWSAVALYTFVGV